MLATSMSFLLKRLTCVGAKSVDAGDEELKKQSKEIEKQLSQDKKKYKQTHRLLLLGNHKYKQTHRLLLHKYKQTHRLLLLGYHKYKQTPRPFLLGNHKNTSRHIATNRALQRAYFTFYESSVHSVSSGVRLYIRPNFVVL